MKRTSLTPLVWLTAITGCSLFLTATPQPVSGQTNSSILPWIYLPSRPIQQPSELEEAKRLHQQVIQLYKQGKYNEAIPIAKRVLEIEERILGENHF